ncbi:lipocalin family protein [Xanthomonas maliensis]|uniref:lipocalin family protein n=1 Tax=Xanthomonas maliensis TaxID=1321368 RepID=UPI00039CA400|nr:lipocalin family protein [Xanthomonas maliensis]KAB7767272.1 hypothetical protein CKY51_11840 [Xanthomonas maliensis]
MRLTVSIALAFLLVLGTPAALANNTPTPEPALDLPKLMGTWYVIARMPNPVERGHVTSRDEYTLVEDGKVAVRYLYREGFHEPEKEVRARASVDAESGNRDWRVWFYRVIPAKQRILEVAPDGSWMLLSYPGRDLAWIFSRTPDMSRDLYRQLVNKMRDDYDIYTDKLLRVPQLPQQVDKLGFEVPEKR